MSGAKYLVTGGFGYVGSVLVDELVRRGSTVIAVDVGLTGRPPRGPNVTSVVADIRDPNCLDGLLRGVDAVVHLAAIVGDRACDIDPQLSWETNYLATVNVTEACRRAGVRRLVFASTCSNYGASFGEVAGVLSPLRPQSLYAETKLLAEHHVLTTRDDRFRPCILRLATVYGPSPRMRFDLAVNVMTARAVAHGQVFVNGGEQWRPFLHVRDAAGAMITALTTIREDHAEVYNCGLDEENYRMVDVGELVAAEVGNTVVTVRPELSDRRDYRVSFASMSTGLGYRCTRRLRDGIRELRDAIATGRYGEYTAAEYDNYLLTQRYASARSSTNSDTDAAPARHNGRPQPVGWYARAEPGQAGHEP